MSRKFLVPVVLPGDPVAPLEATPKQYVDARVGAPPVIISATPPASPVAGQLWYHTNDGVLLVYYDSFWVEVISGGGGTGTYTPPGTVSHSLAAVEPIGWLFLDGRTITGGQTLYPALWAVIPAAMKSGADIILPNSAGRTLVGAGTGIGLSARTLLQMIGVETVALTAAQTGVKGHGHTFTGSAATSGLNSAAHFHGMGGHTHGVAHAHSLSGHHHYLGAHNHGEVIFPGSLGGTTARSYGDYGGGGPLSGPVHPSNVSNQSFSNPAYVQNADSGWSGVPDVDSTAGSNAPTSSGPSTDSSGTQSADHSHNLTATGTVSTLADGAAGASHDNMQPSLVVNMMVKT